MKRRSNQNKTLSQWNRKLFAVLLLSFCFGCLILTQTRYSRIKMILSSSPPFVQRPKIAFLFIARNRLHTDIVWDTFFQGENENRFSIFVHARPGFTFNNATTKSAYFYGRQINDSIQVDWGEASMIEAERILLKNALTDPFNDRFVFLSDSCLPLYNFNYTYDYIMSAPNSFVDSFIDTKGSRYNPKMYPVIPIYNWRKGSQWVVLTRKHAEIVMKDNTVYTMFQKHCRRRPLPEFWRNHPLPADVSKEHNCIPDEHYVQTLLAQEGLEEEITRRSLTHASWDSSSSKDRKRRGWHPKTYKMSDATPALIKSIKNINSIYYETENRREMCDRNGKPGHCFLFARKFTRPAAFRFLKMRTMLVQRGWCRGIKIVYCTGISQCRETDKTGEKIGKKVTQKEHGVILNPPLRSI